MMDDVGLRNYVIDQNPDMAMRLFPHAYTQRTAVDREKHVAIQQWSIDETKTWFYSRSQSVEKNVLKEEETCVPAGSGGGGGRNVTASPGGGGGLAGNGSPCKMSAEKRRKFFQKRGPTRSMPQTGGGGNNPCASKTTKNKDNCWSLESGTPTAELDPDTISCSPNSVFGCSGIASLVRPCQQSIAGAAELGLSRKKFLATNGSAANSQDSGFGCGEAAAASTAAARSCNSSDTSASSCHINVGGSGSGSSVSKALEDVLFQTTLFGWESTELLFDGSGLPYKPPPMPAAATVATSSFSPSSMASSSCNNVATTRTNRNANGTKTSGSTSSSGSSAYSSCFRAAPAAAAVVKSVSTSSSPKKSWGTSEESTSVVNIFYDVAADTYDVERDRLSSSELPQPIRPTGLVRSRDGSHLSPNSQPYISLPSPNIQTAKPAIPQAADSIRQEEEELTQNDGPDTSQLARRGALVPPKMDEEEDIVIEPASSSSKPAAAAQQPPGDAGSSSSHKIDGNSRHHSSSGGGGSGGEAGDSFSTNTAGCKNAGSANSNCSGGGSGGASNVGSNVGLPITETRVFPRRSSVVVIPPMQVCPGDLLVYSKALTHRANFAELDGSTQSLANEADPSAAAPATTSSSKGKVKNPWSILKLFDRDKKSKCESPGSGGGLDEVLSTMAPSEFTDDNLTRLIHIQWGDFVELVEMEKQGAVIWLASNAASGGGGGTSGQVAVTAADPTPATLRSSAQPPSSPHQKFINHIKEEVETDANAVAAPAEPPPPPSAKVLKPAATAHSANPPTAAAGAAAAHSSSAASNLANMRRRFKRAQTTDIAPVAIPNSIATTGIIGSSGGGRRSTSTDRKKAMDLEAALKAQQLIERHSDDDTLDAPGGGSGNGGVPSSSSAGVGGVGGGIGGFHHGSPSVMRKMGVSGRMGGGGGGRATLNSVDKDVFDPTSSARFYVGRESIVSKSEIKRREAVWDLFQSENAFLIDHLMVLKNVFMEPLKKVQVEGFLMFAEPEVLFGNLDELCCVTYSFCKEFLRVLLANVGPEGELAVVDVMKRLFCQSGDSLLPGGKAKLLSEAYHRYTLNYINALNYLESLRRHQDFCDFEKWCNRDLRCKKLQLTDLLVSPVHHIMKIPLVVKDIEARTEDDKEKSVIAKILEMKENSLRELDDKMKWLKNFDRLLEIQRNIVWPSVLEMDPKQFFPEFLKAALSRQPCERLIVSPRRQILIEGTLMLIDSGKPADMHVILFDDLLLISRKKKALSKKKSSLGENWPVAGRLGGGGSSGGSGSGHHQGGGSHHSVDGGHMGSGMKYVVYKQPLSLDRFFIHEVAAHEAAVTKLENAFVLVCLNRFQQIVTVHTFQAETEQLKQSWISKLRDAQEVWKKTLQTTVFKGGSGNYAGCGSTQSPTDKSGAPIL